MPKSKRSQLKKTPSVVRAKTRRTSASAPGTKSKAARHASAAGNNRGLLIFGAILAAVVVLALASKLRQGPPVKLLPVQVLAVYGADAGGSPLLASPRGLAVDAAGFAYVADLGSHRVVKFKPDGTLDAAWGQQGNGSGQFKEPSGVALDGHGDVYVADAWNGRIQKFTANGKYLGEIGSKAASFYSPRNVAVDPQRGYIYVADTGNSCVKKFDADGNLMKSWGEFGTGRERFQETFGLGVDREGLVYVGDAGNRRIKIFTPEGKFVRDLRVKGWRSGVSWPMLAVDAEGRVYASDSQSQMIWIYDRQGKYLGSWGNQPGKDIFAAPLGLAVDADGNVYVSNMNRNQVIKLAPYRGK